VYTHYLNLVLEKSVTRNTAINTVFGGISNRVLGKTCCCWWLKKSNTLARRATSIYQNFIVEQPTGWCIKFCVLNEFVIMFVIGGRSSVSQHHDNTTTTTTLSPI
jgi:hypothetical protein